MFEQFLLIPFPAVHPYQGFLDGLIIGKRGLGVNKKMAGNALIPFLNQPIRLPGLKPGVCSGLILSGVFYPDLKIGVWRRRTYQ